MKYDCALCENPYRMTLGELELHVRHEHNVPLSLSTDIAIIMQGITGILSLTRYLATKGTPERN